MKKSINKIGYKFRSFFTLVRVIGVLTIIAGIVFAIWGASYIKENPNDTFVKDFYANTSTSLISIAITVLVIDFLVEREQETRLKKRLKLRAGSKINSIAVDAVEEMRLYGWLAQGLLSGANLEGANLDNAPLAGAILKNANLFDASLENANLTKADVSDCDMYSARLNMAILPEANFNNSKLNWADFSDTDLEGTTFIGSVLTYANFCGSSLKKANFRNADMKKVNLSIANLEEAILEQF